MDIYGPQVVAKALETSELPLPSLKPLGGTPTLDWRQAAQQVSFAPTHAGSGPVIRDQDRRLLGSVFPLRPQRDIALCTHCKRPFVSAALLHHQRACSPHKHPARRTSLHGVAAEMAGAATTTSTQNGDGANDSESDSKSQVSLRKRKNDSGASGTTSATTAHKPAKKAKQKASKPRAKPVFNIDKQCGVVLPNGQPCARSLTCKAHSMGSKRAVKGRSLPYDTLLSNYQRHNIVKQASISAREAQESDPEDETLTPEAEMAQIMEGIGCTRSVPLDRKVVLSTRTRSQIRMREMLALATLPSELNASGDAIFGRALAYSSETPQQLQFVRAPAQRFYAQRARQRAGQSEAMAGRAP